MILSRRELPAWCSPLPDADHRFSIFYGSPDKVKEYVFTCDKRGVVFRGEYVHTPTGANEVGRLVYHLPADVLIAAGVEAKRRTR